MVPDFLEGVGDLIQRHRFYIFLYEFDKLWGVVGELDGLVVVLELVELYVDPVVVAPLVNQSAALE